MAAELLGVRVQLLSILVWTSPARLHHLRADDHRAAASPNFAALSLLVVLALAAALVGLFALVLDRIAGGIMLGIHRRPGEQFDSIDIAARSRSLVVLAVLLVQREARWDEAR